MKHHGVCQQLHNAFGTEGRNCETEDNRKEVEGSVRQELRFSTWHRVTEETLRGNVIFAFQDILGDKGKWCVCPCMHTCEHICGNICN